MGNLNRKSMTVYMGTIKQFNCALQRQSKTFQSLLLHVIQFFNENAQNHICSIYLIFDCLYKQKPRSVMFVTVYISCLLLNHHKQK